MIKYINVLLLSTVLFFTLFIGGCHKNEQENYPVKIVVVNQTNNTFKAIDLTYLDKNGKEQVLVSDSVSYKESATFELECNGSFTFTIGGTVEDKEIKEYTAILTKTSELWLDIIENETLEIRLSDEGGITNNDVEGL